MKMKLSSLLNFESWHWLRPVGFCLAFAILLILSPQSTIAQVGKDGDEEFVVQIYEVGEFITTSQDHSFRGYTLPGVAPVGSRLGGDGSVRRGGGGFGGGGSGGGGVFCLPPIGPQQIGGGQGGVGGMNIGAGSRIVHGASLMEVIDIIQESVARDSWRDSWSGSKAGKEMPAGTINTLGDTLVISQTPSVHKQIDTFLKMLSQTSVSKQNRDSITISAIWLNIEEAQLESLDVQTDRSVDRAALERLIEQSGSRAQITCLDGQLVHVASGNLKSSIESMIPVVGQNELPNDKTRIADSKKRPAKLPKTVLAQVLAQQPAVTTDGANDASFESSQVGYSPVTRWTNYGTLLQIRPKMERDRQILLDLSSVVVQPGAATKNPVFGAYGIDSHNMHCQQFSTSLRLNDSTPTLVGGSGFDPKAEGKKQTYLIIEAIKVGKPAAER